MRRNWRIWRLLRLVLSIDFLQEPSAENIPDLEGEPNYGCCQLRFRSVCIRVHPWPIQ